MSIAAVVAWLTLSGCSYPGAVGITANLLVESGLDPGSRGGLAQHRGPRARRLRAELGAAWADGEAQLGFIRREAIERGDWDAACGAPSAAAATAVWLQRYERGAGLGQRLRAARLVEGGAYG